MRALTILLSLVTIGAWRAVAEENRIPAIYTVPHEMDFLVKHGHIQGATCSQMAIYLSHAGGIVKIDWKTGRVIKTCEAREHLGDIAHYRGRIYGVYALFDVEPGESRFMVGVWDENLNLVAEKHIPCSNWPGARGLDGAIVIDGTLYTGVDHYGKGWSAPSHSDLTLMAISTTDLSVLGTHEVEFDYPISYGVQSLATDGNDIFFGNYGSASAEVNPNKFCTSSMSKDFKLLRSYQLFAGEGMCLVPKSISRRDTPVFLVVRALGGNMQGWRKDPENNPPQVRLDFFSYSNGEFKDITARSKCRKTCGSEIGGDVTANQSRRERGSMEQVKTGESQQGEL